MHFNYCQIAGGNFGDDLNRLMWPALFPELPQMGGHVAVYGIGTILGGTHARSQHKVVLGSGLGGARIRPLRGSWDFRWVRGPCTALRLRLAPERALGDPASLWPVLQASPTGEGAWGLMPHHATWDGFDWEQVAGQAGMLAINPKQSPVAVVAQMRRCSRVLSESLHGAIFADALGIPWAGCVLSHRFNQFKWRDWLATVNRPFSPFVADRPLVRQISRNKALRNRFARWSGYLRGSRNPALRAVAPSSVADAWQVSDALARYAGHEGNFACSPAQQVETQRQRMLQACQTFARDYGLRCTA